MVGRGARARPTRPPGARGRSCIPRPRAVAVARRSSDRSGSRTRALRRSRARHPRASPGRAPRHGRRARRPRGACPHGCAGPSPGGARVTSRALARRCLLGGAGPAAALGGIFVLLVRGELTIDLGIGRTFRPLGPLTWRIEAPPEVVFEVLSAPYLERTPRALESKLRVLEWGTDMVLAEHFTRVGGLIAR